MMNQRAIQINGISKKYKVKTQPHNTLRDLIADAAKSVFKRNGRGAAKDALRDEFWALKDVSFEVNRGEIAGIVGHNGAGKSTLLKILSHITEPTEGSAEIHGRVGSLLEVGTGFNWELSGRENIFLYGAILGMKKEEILRKFDAIVEFAEIAKFLEIPVKRYSSGMYVRLAFSVAAHLEPEILLLDEVLAVGDLEFQRKCLTYAKSLREKNSTILFVSHSMFAIKAMCTRVICLAEGQVAFDGSTEEGIRFYERQIRSGGFIRNVKDYGFGSPVQITEMETLDEAGRTRSVFDHGERMRIRLRYEAPSPLDDPNFIIAFIRSDNVACNNFSTVLDGLHIPVISGQGTVEVLTPPLKLVSDSYTIKLLVRDRSFQRLYCDQTGAVFHVKHDLMNSHFGVFHEPGEWSWSDGSGEAPFPAPVGANAREVDIHD